MRFVINMSMSSLARVPIVDQGPLLPYFHQRGSEYRSCEGGIESVIGMIVVTGGVQF